MRRNPYCFGLDIVTVPEPAAYILHKLYINALREQEKQKKDIRAIRELLKHVKASDNDNAKLKTIFASMQKSHQNKILEAAKQNFIEL